MRKSSKSSPEVVERAVRMVFGAKDHYPSQWAAIESIAGKIGCTAETLRRWVRRAERDQGLREGLSTAEHQALTARTHQLASKRSQPRCTEPHVLLLHCLSGLR